MSGYTRTNVYDYVNRIVLRSYPDAYISGRYEPVPSSFPAVCLREISRFSEERNVTFSGTQGVKRSGFEAQVITADEDSGMEDAEALMDCVAEAFRELYYINTGRNVIEDGDRGIYRIVGTFRRVIGTDDVIPEVPPEEQDNSQNEPPDEPAEPGTGGEGP